MLSDSRQIDARSSYSANSSIYSCSAENSTNHPIEQPKESNFDNCQQDSEYFDVLSIQVPTHRESNPPCSRRKRLANSLSSCFCPRSSNLKSYFKPAKPSKFIPPVNKKPTHHRDNNHVKKVTTMQQAKAQGSYDSELASPNGDEERMMWTTNFLAAVSIFLIIVTFPFSLLYCIRIVTEYERAVVLRMGNLIPKGRGVKGPGLFFILPCVDSVRKVDLRTVTFAIPPQELLTRDSVTVSVDAVVYYRVLNPVASVLNIEDAARSTRLLAQTTIRNVLGTKDLAQILMDRDEISTIMQTSLDATTDAWGIKVERIEIKDVRLPVQLQRAMAAEAEAAREARAKIIAATGEQEAARSLTKAARVISTSPMALQLRYLQTLSTISAEKHSTIFFPVPIDIVQSLSELSKSTGGGWSGIGSKPSLTSPADAIRRQRRNDDDPDPSDGSRRMRSSTLFDDLADWMHEDSRSDTV